MEEGIHWECGTVGVTFLRIEREREVQFVGNTKSVAMGGTEGRKGVEKFLNFFYI